MKIKTVHGLAVDLRRKVLCTIAVSLLQFRVCRRNGE